MDFLFKLKRKVVVAIGLIFILYGVAGSIFKFNVKNGVFENLSFILMIFVLYLYFGKRNKNASREKTEGSQEIPESASTDVDKEGKEAQNERNESEDIKSETDKE
jgi:uncharacterized membrane protein YfcA